MHSRDISEKIRHHTFPWRSKLHISPTYISFEAKMACPSVLTICRLRSLRCRSPLSNRSTCRRPHDECFRKLDLHSLCSMWQQLRLSLWDMVVLQIHIHAYGRVWVTCDPSPQAHVGSFFFVLLGGGTLVGKQCVRQQC